MHLSPPSKNRKLTGAILEIAKITGWCALGGLLSLLGFFVYHLENRADLSLWHKAKLDAEFTVNSKAENFEDYLAIEKQVFRQLDELIYEQVPVGRQQLINRYSRDSVSHPERWTPNWNRTFELPITSPDAGVLLLHGMSDSPYSLRGIGQQLNIDNSWVLGLRFPGHGTAPSGLTRLRWQDMARSVELAMAHLREKVGDKPIYIIGYSAGGALAVYYALQALDEPLRPKAAGIVLISPAIGVTPLAAFAVWQARLGYLLGLDKLEWSDIKLEYDPFKYNSFAVNAGDQVYRLTEAISSLLAAYGADKSLDKMPPMLAFQSSVDATVSSRALVEGLFMKLPPARHELVLFDINRQSDIEQVLKKDPVQAFKPMLENENLPFTLSIVRNRNEKVSSTSVYRRARGGSGVEEIQIPLTWPADLYSLSHVALPFSENDALYGKTGSSTPSGIRLGDLALRGERGVVRIPPGDMLRLRWNPFYPLIEQRILDFVK
ncbi:MAG: alpha/beta hydrolase [Proteobacteria bacterium]|nr:alpha/beta hydrolase [Pseudomonadota bacterium]